MELVGSSVVTGSYELSEGRGFEVTSISFHPTEPVAVFCCKNYIVIYDVFSSTFTASLQVEHEAVLCSISQSHVAAACDDGSVFVWDYHSLELLATYAPKDGAQVTILQLAPWNPVLFICRMGSKYIFCYDLTPKNLGKVPNRFDCKKLPTSLACHPNDHFVACYVDGVIRIFDFISGTVRSQNDDILKMLQAHNLNILMPGYISFGMNGNYLAASTENGLLACFRVDDKVLTLSGSRTVSLGVVHSVVFHMYLPLFFTGSTDGLTLAWTVGCKPSGLINVELIGELESVQRVMSLPDYARPALPMLVSTGITVHSSLNMLSFTFNHVGDRASSSASSFVADDSVVSEALPKVDSLEESSNELSQQLRHVIYHLQDQFYPLKNIPNVSGAYSAMDNLITHNPSNQVEIPNQFYFLDGSRIVSQSITKGKVIITNLPEQDKEGNLVFPIRQEYDQNNHSFLVFFEKMTVPDDSIYGKRRRSYLFSTIVGDTAENIYASELQNGRDGFLLPESNLGHHVTLVEDGKAIQFWEKESVKPKNIVKLTSRALRIFAAPRGMIRLDLKGKGVEALDLSKDDVRKFGKVLVYMMHNGTDIATMALFTGEMVCQLLWRKLHDGRNVCAILTTTRLLIVSESLELMAQSPHPDTKLAPLYNSMAWAGYTLIYSTPGHISYLTLEGRSGIVASIPFGLCCIASIWLDRIVITRQYMGKIIVEAVPVGLLEPLVLGLLAVPGIPQDVVQSRISMLLARFDSTRISSQLISRLEELGYCDVATALTTRSSLYPLNQKVRLAMHALELEQALKSILEELSKLDSPSVPGKTTKLPAEVQDLLIHLGNMCSNVGQFELAKQCFEISNSSIPLIYLMHLSANLSVLDSLRKNILGNYPDSAQTGILSIVQNVQNTYNATWPNRALQNWAFKSLCPSYDTCSLSSTGMYASETEDTKSAVKPYGFLDRIERWFSMPFDLSLGQKCIGDSANRRSPLKDFEKKLQKIVWEVTKDNRTKGHFKLHPPPREQMTTRRCQVSAPSSSLSQSNSSAGATNTEIDLDTEDMTETGESDVEVAFTKTGEKVKGVSGLRDLADGLEVNSDFSAEPAPFPTEEEEEEEEEQKELAATLQNKQNSEEEQEQENESEDKHDNENDHDHNNDEESTKDKKKPEGNDESHTKFGDDENEEKNEFDGSKQEKNTEEEHTETDSDIAKTPPPRSYRKPTNAQSTERPDPRASFMMAASGAKGRSLLDMAASPSASSPGSMTAMRKGKRTSISKLTGPIIESAKCADEKLLFESSLDHLEHGFLPFALTEIESAICKIVQNPEKKNMKKEMRQCVQYKLAMKLLVEIKMNENTEDDWKIAKLCDQLAVVQVKPEYKLMFVRIAISKNMQVENYGVAAEWLKTILRRNHEDTPTLQSRLQECEDKENTDKYPRPLYNPFGSKSGSSNVMPKYCYDSFDWLVSENVIHCEFCNAIFSTLRKKVEETCSYCRVGVLAMRDTKKKYLAFKEK